MITILLPDTINMKCHKTYGNNMIP